MTVLLPTFTTPLLCYSVVQQPNLSIFCLKYIFLYNVCIFVEYTLCALEEWLTPSSSPLLQLGYDFLIFLLDSTSNIITNMMALISARSWAFSSTSHSGLHFVLFCQGLLWWIFPGWYGHHLLLRILVFCFDQSCFYTVVIINNIEELGLYMQKSKLIIKGKL